MLIGIFILDLDVFGFEAFFRFFASVLGNVVLLTVVGGDFLLALLRAGHLQSRALIESELEAPLEARFDALAAAGLGGLGAKPSP